MPDELVAYQLSEIKKMLEQILVQVRATNGRVDKSEDDIIRLQERLVRAEERAEVAEARAVTAEAQVAKVNHPIVIIGSLVGAVVAACWAAWERFTK